MFHGDVRKHLNFQAKQFSPSFKGLFKVYDKFRQLVCRFYIVTFVNVKINISPCFQLQQSGNDKGPDAQSEAFRQMLSQHMVSKKYPYIL